MHESKKCFYNLLKYQKNIYLNLEIQSPNLDLYISENITKMLAIWAFLCNILAKYSDF